MTSVPVRERSKRFWQISIILRSLADTKSLPIGELKRISHFLQLNSQKLLKLNSLTEKTKLTSKRWQLCLLQDDDEPRITSNEVQQKLSRLFQCVENTCDKTVLQEAIDLIKHYQMRITGMETTLTNMCQVSHSTSFLSLFHTIAHLQNIC